MKCFVTIFSLRSLSNIASIRFVADAITNHHVKTKEGYKMNTVYKNLFGNLIDFASNIIEDLKELFARVEKLEQPPKV